MPSTLSLISNMFRVERQRTVAIAIWSTSLPLGGAVGMQALLRQVGIETSQAAA